MVNVLCVFLTCKVIRKRKKETLSLHKAMPPVELVIGYLCCANVLEDGVMEYISI